MTNPLLSISLHNCLKGFLRLGKSEKTRGRKVKGKKLKFAHTEKSRAMEAEIKELNRFLVSFELEGAGFSGYRRLFHEGDVEGFDFQWSGRIYGVGDYN